MFMIFHLCLSGVCFSLKSLRLVELKHSNKAQLLDKYYEASDLPKPQGCYMKALLYNVESQIR